MLLIRCFFSTVLTAAALLLLAAAGSEGFVVPQQSSLTTISQQKTLQVGGGVTSSPFRPPPKSTALALLPPPTAQLVAGAASSTEMNPLLTYFLQTVISNGVPAAFAVLVIGFTVMQFRGGRRDENEGRFRAGNASSSPVAQLYDDLYGDQDQDPFKKKGAGGFNPFFGPLRDKNNNRREQQLPKNTGVPAKQYLQVTHLNQKYDSFRYSLAAATQSKAIAAAQYRQSAWERAWTKALSSPLPPAVYQKLQKLEQAFLKEAALKQQELQSLQTAVQRAAMDEEMKHMGMESVYELDPAAVAIQDAKNNETAAVNSNRTKSSSRAALQLAAVGRLQAALLTLETDFVRDVLAAVGPANAAAVRTAVLGKGSSLLSDGAGRPLTRLLGGGGDGGGDGDSVANRKKRVFVTRFPGDVEASQVANLREEVTAIVQSAAPGDEALLVLKTGGGTVTGYGLAAAQLMRFRQAGLKLTVAVEQVAASGGYMMACIADKIVASPFAVLGSIGVITDIPNFYERLKEEGIEFQTVTAGKYKRTLTPTKKVTKEDFQKTKENVEDIFFLFRDFVAENRPQLDIEKIATGETWFGTAALERKLCDEIKTVDDVLVDFVNGGYDVFEVAYKPPPAETALGRLLLPVGADSSSDSPVSNVVRWLVRTVASAVKSELSSLDVINKPVQERYMAMDETADRVRIQD